VDGVHRIDAVGEGVKLIGLFVFLALVLTDDFLGHHVLGLNLKCISKYTEFAFAAEGAEVLGTSFGHGLFAAEHFAAEIPPQIRRVSGDALLIVDGVGVFELGRDCRRSFARFWIVRLCEAGSLGRIGRILRDFFNGIRRIILVLLILLVLLFEVVEFFDERLGGHEVDSEVVDAGFAQFVSDALHGVNTI